VADTGIGIAPEHLRTIFEEFHQAESASNRRYEGTGLGLAICRRFIELHGGRIWAESTSGVGSTFSFSLPITVTPPPEPVQVITTPNYPGTVVLVIDDDPNAIEIVTRQLQQSGTYTVTSARGGQAGLDAIAESHPDLIILDLMMPEIDGFAVLEQLDRTPLTHTIPVIVLTAKDLTLAEREILNQRVHGLLNKDLTPPEHLLGKVTDLLGTLMEVPALNGQRKGEN